VVSNAQGKTFFVAGVWPGEKGVFQELSSSNKVNIAKLNELVSPSPYRVNAPCRYHGYSARYCGACPWQFIDYKAQLAFKQEKIEKALLKVFADANIKTIAPSEKTLSYRNRTQLKTDGVRLGYVAANSNAIVDVEDCLILSDHNRSTLLKLREKLPNSLWRNKKNKAWTTLDIDEDISVGGVSVNKRLPFKQANAQQNAFMKTWLGERLSQNSSSSHILELFCGSGNLTEVIAESTFDKIVAAEYDEEAIARLSDKNLPSVDARCVNLYEEPALKLLLTKVKKTNILVLDPPRDGLKHAKIITKKLGRLHKIYYVSCNLATFTRDVMIFSDAGFQLRELQAVDQFPHTPHIELLAELYR